MVSIDLQSGILVIGFVPCKDRRIVLPVLSSVQVDSDRVRRNGLPVHDLGSKIISGIGVLQFVIIVRLAVWILIFSELPEHRADLQPVPFQIFTDLISRDQISFVVNDVELICFVCIVPYTGVYDDLLSLLNFADTGLLCDIGYKVVVLNDRKLCKAQPFIDSVSGCVALKTVRYSTAL